MAALLTARLRGSFGSDDLIALGERGALQPGAWRRSRAFAWMIALAVLVVVPASFAILELNRIVAGPDSHRTFLIEIIGGGLALTLYALGVRFGEKRVPGELSLSRAVPHVLVGLAVGATLFAAVMTLLVELGGYRVAWHGSAAMWEPGGLAIRAALIEEIVARGVILRLLWRIGGPLLAFLISALLFGAAHLLNPGAAVLAALSIAVEAGVMLGAFYALTGRLWMSIGVHAAWNFTQGYVFGAAVSGEAAGPSLWSSVARPEASAWLTGGRFGPEASLPALVLCAAAGSALLFAAWKAGRLDPATDGFPDL